MAKPGTFKKGVPRHPLAGRKKGTPNKVTKLLKDQILDALEEAGGEGGGQKWLVDLARNRPESFASLLGKVLPTQITGDGGGPVVFTWANQSDSQ